MYPSTRICTQRSRRESIFKVGTVTENWLDVGCDILRGIDGVRDSSEGEFRTGLGWSCIYASRQEGLDTAIWHRGHDTANVL